jgi:hypothetical protein
MEGLSTGGPKKAQLVLRGACAISTPSMRERRAGVAAAGWWLAVVAARAGVAEPGSRASLSRGCDGGAAAAAARGSCDGLHGAAVSRHAAPARVEAEQGAARGLLIFLLLCVELRSVRFPPNNQAIKSKLNLSVLGLKQTERLLFSMYLS